MTMTVFGYQTRKTVFEYISKRVEISQKYSATRRIFKHVLKRGLSCLI